MLRPSMSRAKDMSLPPAQHFFNMRNRLSSVLLEDQNYILAPASFGVGGLGVSGGQDKSAN